MFLNYIFHGCLSYRKANTDWPEIQHTLPPEGNWMFDLLQDRNYISSRQETGGAGDVERFLTIVCLLVRLQQSGDNWGTEQAGSGSSGVEWSGGVGSHVWTACSCYIGCVDHPSLLLSLTHYHHWPYTALRAVNTPANIYHLNSILSSSLIFAFLSPLLHLHNIRCRMMITVLFADHHDGIYTMLSSPVCCVVILRWDEGNGSHCYNCQPPINPRIGISIDNLA